MGNAKWSLVSREGSATHPDIQTTLEGLVVDQDWTFSKADTSYLTHGLHDYPARMIPQIARRLIERYSPKGGRVLDPFCGSGTTLVEARLMGRDSVGSDVNPFALLLAKVKSTPIDFRRSKFAAAAFLRKVDGDHRRREKAKALPATPSRSTQTSSTGSRVTFAGTLSSSTRRSSKWRTAM